MEQLPHGGLIIDRPNHGGYLDDYIKTRDLLESLGTPIEIRSECNSACTIYLSLDNLCITESASFTFHSTGDPKADAFLLDTYPEDVRNWIRGKGGLTSLPITLSWVDAKHFLDRC